MNAIHPCHSDGAAGPAVGTSLRRISAGASWMLRGTSWSYLPEQLRHHLSKRPRSVLATSDSGAVAAALLIGDS